MTGRRPGPSIGSTALGLASCLATSPAQAAEPWASEMDRRRYAAVVAANRDTPNPALTRAVARHAPEGRVPLIPRRDLIVEDPVKAVLISRSGSAVAGLSNEGPGQSLWWVDVASRQRKRLLHGRVRRLLAFSPDEAFLFFEGPDGLASIRVATAGVAYLSALDPGEGDRILGTDPHRPHHILLRRVAGDGVPTVERIDVEGNVEELYRGDLDVQEVATNGQGSIAFLKAPSGVEQVVYRMDGGRAQAVARCDFFDPCSLLGWNDRRQALLMRTRAGADLVQLAYLDPATGSWSTVHRDPERSGDLQRAVVGEAPLIAAYEDGSRSYGLTPGMRSHLESLRALLPRRQLQVSPRPASGVWLVREASSTLQHPRFHLYDEATRALTPLFAEETAAATVVPEHRLSPKVAFAYRAADGYRLHGFVTLPIGMPLDRSPVVVRPHGGPFIRTSASFSARTQFLANRGYVVIEPNFRGSVGHGLDYVTASARDFGDGIVQGDIVDALFHLLGLGIGDRERVAIHGGSFGGFSTLAGLTFTPQLFRVGIAESAPPDLVRALRSLAEDEDMGGGIRRDAAAAAYVVDLADERDVERLRRQSPEAHLDAVSRPLLMIVGAQDSQVPVQDVQHYALQLDARDKPVSLFVAEREGHVFAEPLAIRASYYLVERMLSEHLGGRREPGADPRLERFIARQMRIDRCGLSVPLAARPGNRDGVRDRTRSDGLGQKRADLESAGLGALAARPGNRDGVRDRTGWARNAPTSSRRVLGR